MKKTNFPSLQSTAEEVVQVSSVLHAQYLDYIEECWAGVANKEPITDEEMHACDHCEAPWDCVFVCLDNFVKFRKRGDIYA
jgi:hypothetical protein